MPRIVPYYPVSLDVDGRSCLVVGGGPVAARKVRGLTACGALVTVIAPSIEEPITALARGGAPGTGSVSLVRRRYRRGEAAGYRLVVTATGVPEVDHAVAADAEAAGVWVNSADDAANCSFLLPSVYRDGPVSVAISTGGASPALAAWLRERAAGSLGPDLAILAALLEEGRHLLRAEGRSTESVDWQRLLDGPLTGLVRAGRIDEARRLLHDAARGVSSVGPPSRRSR